MGIWCRNYWQNKTHLFLSHLCFFPRFRHRTGFISGNPGFEITLPHHDQRKLFPKPAFEHLAASILEKLRFAAGIHWNGPICGMAIHHTWSMEGSQRTRKCKIRFVTWEALLPSQEFAGFIMCGATRSLCRAIQKILLLTYCSIPIKGRRAVDTQGSPYSELLNNTQAGMALQHAYISQQSAALRDIFKRKLYVAPTI